MSVRVNLLPGEVRARGQANRARVLGGVVAAAFLVVLAALTLMQRADISDAEDRLAVVEAQNAELQTDITALQPFADLRVRATDGVSLLSSAMAREAALASILQDLSAVLPPTVELQTISLSITEAPGAPSAGGVRPAHGTMTATGRTTSIAPGVERLLIDLGRVAAFDNVYVTNASTNDEGVTTFELSIEFGQEILTGRYGDASPEVAS